MDRVRPRGRVPALSGLEGEVVSASDTHSQSVSEQMAGGASPTPVSSAQEELGL